MEACSGGKENELPLEDLGTVRNGYTICLAALLFAEMEWAL